jgi:hypothetical protein
MKNRIHFTLLAIEYLLLTSNHVQAEELNLTNKAITPSTQESMLAKTDVAVLNALTQTGQAKVIINLRDPLDMEATLQARRQAIAQIQTAVLAQLPEKSFILKRRYHLVSALAGTITPAALVPLQQHADVISIQADNVVSTNSPETKP